MIDIEKLKDFVYFKYKTNFVRSFGDEKTGLKLVFDDYSIVRVSFTDNTALYNSSNRSEARNYDLILPYKAHFRNIKLQKLIDNGRK